MPTAARLNGPLARIACADATITRTAEDQRLTTTAAFDALPDQEFARNGYPILDVHF